jgi:catechol 2,3-dioxygenase-like lactoylglutathione lyase family enzyme
MPKLGAVINVSIAVSRFEEALFFYEALLDLLGFELGDVARGADARRLTVAVKASAGVAVTIREAKPCDIAPRLTLSADNRERVDEACVLVEWLGGQILDGPRTTPGHGESRYAVRFRGPDRLTVEVVHDLGRTRGSPGALSGPL